MLLSWQTFPLTDLHSPVHLCREYHGQYTGHGFPILVELNPNILVRHVERMHKFIMGVLRGCFGRHFRRRFMGVARGRVGSEVFKEQADFRLRALYCT